MLRMVFDLDGVIACGSAEEVYSDAAGWAYGKCKPMDSFIKVLRVLKEKGIHIIIFTARWETDRSKTEAWLHKHKVPYGELIFGKPFAHLYLDDRSFPPFRCEENAQDKAEELISEAKRNRDATYCPV